MSPSNRLNEDRTECSLVVCGYKLMVEQVIFDG